MTYEQELRNIIDEKNKELAKMKEERDQLIKERELVAWTKDGKIAELEGRIAGARLIQEKVERFIQHMNDAIEGKLKPPTPSDTVIILLDISERLKIVLASQKGQK